MRNVSFKKGLVVGITLLFIGLIFIPSFNAVSISQVLENESKIVEFETDNCILLFTKFLSYYFLALTLGFFGNRDLGEFFIYKAVETFSYAHDLCCKWASWWNPDLPPDPKQILINIL